MRGRVLLWCLAIPIQVSASLFLSQSHDNLLLTCMSHYAVISPGMSPGVLPGYQMQDMANTADKTP